MRSSRAILLATSIALAACGKEVPKPRAPDVTLAPRFVKELDPVELFPSDLDLVVRVDLARLKAGMSSQFVSDLAKSTKVDAGDALLRFLLPCADTLWVALRTSDLESGDRVVAIEGKDCIPKLDDKFWKQAPDTANGALRIWDRKTPAPRDETARVIRIGDRRVVLVSPVEIDSVQRVLRDGPDASRADPRAEGVVSIDLRARGLSPSTAERFPSLASIFRGVTRVKANATLDDDGMRVEGEIACKNAASAEKVQAFFAALHDNSGEAKSGALVRSLSFEIVASIVRVKWRVPPEALRAALAAASPDGNAAP